MVPALEDNPVARAAISTTRCPTENIAVTSTCYDRGNHVGSWPRVVMLV